MRKKKETGTSTRGRTTVKSTSERYVQRQIILYLRKFGWLVVNTSGAWRSARGMTGFPDIIAFGWGNTLLIECKAKDGQLRPKQKQFLKKMDPHIGKRISYNVVRAGEFERFLGFLKDWYFLLDLKWTQEMSEWRPKHDHLI